MRRALLAAIALLETLLLFAQETPAGGVKGRVLSKTERCPLEHVRVRLMDGAALVQEVCTDARGNFLLEEVPDGTYLLVFQGSGYLENRLPVMVAEGRVKNVFNILLGEVNRASDSWEDAPGASSDLHKNYSSLLFGRTAISPQPHRIQEEVTLAGVRMDEEDPTLYGGLLEALRNSRFTSGAGLSETAFGGLNSVTEISATASSMRSGFRSSLSTDNALYGLRAEASYATGPLGGGWNLAANLSGSAWRQPGTEPYAFYMGVDKSLGKAHKLSSALMRDVSTLSFLRYDFQPPVPFRAFVTALGRFSEGGGTSLHLAGAFTWHAGRRMVLSGGVDGRSSQDSGRAGGWLAAQLSAGQWGFSAGVQGGVEDLSWVKGPTYTGKVGVSRLLGKTLRVYANAGLSKLSPAHDTRYFCSDVNLALDTNGANMKLTGFYESPVGTGDYHLGMDLAFKVPIYIIPNLSLQGQVTAGHFGSEMQAEPTLLYGGLSWSANAWFVDGGFLYRDDIPMADLSAGKTWALEGQRQVGVAAGFRPFFGHWEPPVRYSFRVFCTL